MVMHVKAIVVIAIVIGRIKSEETTVASFVKNENVKDVKAESAFKSIDNPSPSKQNLKSYEELYTESKDFLKYFSGHTNSTERLRKPFLYGKKFEFPLEEQKESSNGELYSPIITSAILTLPYNTANLGSEVQNESDLLKENQNEIYTSTLDHIKKTTAESFNKTYFAGDINESDNKEKKAAAEKTKEIFEEGNNFSSRLRQQGERALLVVLPFKADEENVEELFTKSPMVKVIQNDELNAGFRSEGTDSLPVTTEIIPTTYKSVTRKRWRPMKRYQLLTEPYNLEMSTENGQDVTKKYTNYDDVEMVTKKYQESSEEPEKFTNHRYEEKFTPYPVYKKLKINQDESTEIVQLLSDRRTEKKPKRKGQRRKSTTEGPPKPEELSKVLDVLPPDVKDLILQIGLNKENKEQQTSEDKFRLERAPQPTIDPKSYSVFKPLPLVTKNENRSFVSDDMKDFLASFGLLSVSRRVHKSLKENGTEADKNIMVLDLDFLPNDLKSLLEEMGLVKSDEKKEPTRIHIFNPSNYSIAPNEEDKEKLNAILSSIKTTVNESQSLTPEMQLEIIAKIRDLNNLRYKAGNLTYINNEIQKIVVNKSGDKKPRTARRVIKLNEGPDPLVFHDESLLKNDVKRQESANSSSESTYIKSSSSSEAVSVSNNASGPSPSADAETVIEETPNIEALKESFGGGGTAPDDADIESSLPPKRPNGLYLLLDWNSFLEVGTEDDSRRVNLRFQPKIGDSRNFLPVSVP